MNDLMTNSFTCYTDLRKAAMKDLEAGPDSDLANKTDENLSCFLEEAEKVKALSRIRARLLGDAWERLLREHGCSGSTAARGRSGAARGARSASRGVLGFSGSAARGSAARGRSGSGGPQRGEIGECGSGGGTQLGRGSALWS
ncbi:hypothetical protein F2Q69_00045738 [Brassica cretica]|uniref:Uncharacterized protein n=1 Tax=Brassica cretica TaxID=69181 RepID=A0A8S9N666_BRACR|nr:hypothetical protein F2Q69_00045738 [Brassica cretica]